MRTVADWLNALLGSLAGRLTLILSFGVTVAAGAALLIADQVHQDDFQHLRMSRVAASAADIAERLKRAPGRTDQLLRQDQILGAHEAPPTQRSGDRLPALERMIDNRLGREARAQASQVDRTACFSRPMLAPRAAGLGEQAFPECWRIVFRDAHGQERRLLIDLPPADLPTSIFDPWSLALTFAISAFVSLLVARLVTAPLRRLTRAARTFSLTIDPEAIQETGPREIRAALRTFNIMQHRVREGFRERTHILAAIAHDLQTPLTRLRLRVEEVGDPVLRERLVADLAGMHQLVRDGLDLARSSETREQWSLVNIDSIVSSVAEDRVELGGDVSLGDACHLQVRTKPTALLRCLTNLVDNAVKHGGDAELSAFVDGTDLVIRVRDHGPGLDDLAIREAFEPFKRGERSADRAPGGTGIGLTIARAQAQTFGAKIELARHKERGLVADIRLVDAVATARAAAFRSSPASTLTPAEQ